jgi:hypothetical protein
MKAELVPDNGDPPIPITRDVTVVGRRPYCDVVIDHPSLSKRHCVLVKTDGLLVIRDLASTNGTKVKGQKIRWAALLPDDRIAFGGYKLRVYLGSDDAPSPSELARTGGATKKTAYSPAVANGLEPNDATVRTSIGGFGPPSSPETLIPSRGDALSPKPNGNSPNWGDGLEILDDEEDVIVELE